MTPITRLKRERRRLNRIIRESNKDTANPDRYDKRECKQIADLRKKVTEELFRPEVKGLTEKIAKLRKLRKEQQVEIEQ